MAAGNNVLLQEPDWPTNQLMMPLGIARSAGSPGQGRLLGLFFEMQPAPRESTAFRGLP